MTELSKRRLQSTLKLILLASLVAILIITAQKFHLTELVRSAFMWVKTLGPAGPIAYIVIYNLATLLFIPGSILTIKGGCLFGAFWGSVYVFIAATIGAVGAFLIGRYLSRDWVSQQISKYPKFKAIDRAVAKEGWKIVLLTRLSPLFPFNLLNYAFGVTQISIKDYVLGSIGMVPGTVMYVYIGSLASDLTMINNPSQPATMETQIAQWVIRVIGLIATVAVTVYITHLSKKAIDQSVLAEEIQPDTTKK